MATARIIELLVAIILVVTTIGVTWYLSTIGSLVPPSPRQPLRSCVANRSSSSPMECASDNIDPQRATGQKWNNNGCFCLEECVAGTCTCPMNGLYIDGNYSWAAVTSYDYGNATSTTCRVWPSTQSPSGTYAMNIFLTFIPLSPGLLAAWSAAILLIKAPKQEQWKERIAVVIACNISLIILLIDFCMGTWKSSRTTTDYWTLRLSRQIIIECIIPMCIAVFHRIFKPMSICASIPYTLMASRIIIGIIAWIKHDANLFVISSIGISVMVIAWFLALVYVVLFQMLKDANRLMPVLLVHMNFWTATLLILVFWAANSAKLPTSILGSFINRGTEAVCECFFFCAVLWLFGGFDKKMNAIMAAKYATNGDSDAMLAAAIITSPLGSIPVKRLPTYAEQIAAYKVAREEAKRAKAAKAGITTSNTSTTSGGDDATITTPLHDGNSTSIEVSDISAVTVYPVAVATHIPPIASTAPSLSSSSSSRTGALRGVYSQII